MTDDWWIEKDLEWGGSDLIEILPQNLPRGTEKTYKIPQPEEEMFRPKFEPRTSRIQIWSVTAMPVNSLSTQLSSFSDGRQILTINYPN
jgi:hypothetical protein